MPKFRDRLYHAWSAFNGRDHPVSVQSGPVSNYRPDRTTLTRGNERSIITAIYNRIALDVSAVPIKHVRLDQQGRYLSDIRSGLNECLTLSTNTDQTSRAFIQDVVLSMFDEGCVAIVPTDTDINPNNSSSFDILAMRVGQIMEWRPKAVKVRVYNEATGKREDIILAKHAVAIVENPFYAVMNQANSTLNRLLRKIAIKDQLDDKLASKKLNMIIQVPYDTHSDMRRKRAQDRITDFENQLERSEYGIAYADATENITQLNRPLENDINDEIASLTDLLYSQLGITQAVMNGTASEEEMIHYTASTVEPILHAITQELKRKFLTKTARTQGQSIEFYKNSFKLVTLEKLAVAAGTLSQNAIVTANEIRSEIGLPPSDDPRSDMPINNMINPVDQDPNMIDPNAMDPMEQDPSMMMPYEEEQQGYPPEEPFYEDPYSEQY